jgi:Co/Zn/Cd efflux system component
VICAFWSGSLALLADAGHMLTDASGHADRDAGSHMS